MFLNRVYKVEKVVRMRARSFSWENAGKWGGRRADSVVVGQGLVVLRPMPMTERYSTLE